MAVLYVGLFLLWFKSSRFFWKCVWKCRQPLATWRAQFSTKLFNDHWVPINLVDLAECEVMQGGQGVLAPLCLEAWASASAGGR